MEWSVFFQTPDFQERTRLFLIAPELKPLVRAWCGLKDGMRILDVGCGTGYFSRLLLEGSENVSVTGLDCDKLFIENADRTAKEQGLSVSFLVGDALNLPFPDAAFDLVVSHTFLTSVHDPGKAMAEMMRVVKPGCMIASVTPMSMFPYIVAEGRYPEDCTWVNEFKRLLNLMYGAYYRFDPLRNYRNSLPMDKLPAFFADQGLTNICAYPLGKFFSLSNAAITEEEKELWIRLYLSSEEKKLDTFLSFPEAQELVSREDAEHFRELLHIKCKWLSDHIGENTVWEWQGGANLLITAVRP